MTSKQVIGSNYSKIINVEDEKEENCPFFKSNISKKRESLNILIKDRLYRASVDPILDENNKISGFVQFMSDITEHKAFQESEEKYRALAKNINVGIYRNTVGKKGKFIEANPAIVKMFGFRNRSEFLEHNVSELYLHPEERNKFNNEMLQKGFVKNEELQLKRKDGTAFYGSVSAVTIKDKDGHVQFYDGIIEDITVRKKAEMALLESENNLRTIFHAMTDIVMEIDLNGRYISIAPTSPKLLYKPSAELLGKKLHDVFPKPIADMFLNSFRKCLSENKTKIIEYPLIINDKTIWFEGRITPKTNNSVLLISHDMTKRKITTKALKESEKKYRDLFEKSKDAILIIENGKFVDCNQSTIDMLRYKNKEEFLNSHPSKLSPEKQPNGETSYIKANEMMEIALKNGSHRFEWNHKRSDGEVFPVEVVLTAISSDKENQIIHTIWRDITERKHNEKIQEIIFNISTAILATDSLEELIKLIHKELGRIIDATNFYIAFYDKETNTFSLPFFTDTKDKMITFPAENTLTNYVRTTKKPLLANKKLINKLLRSGKIEKVGVNAKVWLGVPLKVEKKITGVLAVQNYADEFAYNKSDLKMLEFVSSQISISIERKRTELEIKESEERYKYLFNQSPTSIWEEDFSEVYKYLTSLKQMGIKNIKEYFENNPNETMKCSKMVQILDVNERTISLFNAKDKNELLTNLDSIFTVDSLPTFIDQLCMISQNKTRYSGESINVALDGKLINVSIKWNVVPGYEKNYSKVLVSLIDITEQKKAQEDLRIGRERLKLLNQVIRHDIANDFIVIKSAINIFKRSSDMTILDEIDKRVMKSIKTIDNYKKYEEFIASNASLKEVEITKLFNELIVEFPNNKFNIEGKCKVFADDTLNSVFINLITNSIKHGNSTQINIIISSNDKMCEIRFADNGVGILDKYKDKIFDKGFFYGKSGNTGMGLYIVRKTIEHLGGSIFFEDNKPNGAVFLINLRKSLGK